MNSYNRVRCLATLRKRKQREKDCRDSKRPHELQLWEMSPSTYLLAMASTINFHTLSHSLSHDLDTTCTVQVHMNILYIMYFVYYMYNVNY